MGMKKTQDTSDKEPTMRTRNADWARQITTYLGSGDCRAVTADEVAAAVYAAYPEDCPADEEVFDAELKDGHGDYTATLGDAGLIRLARMVVTLRTN
jgi:hypothetical protein